MNKLLAVTFASAWLVWIVFVVWVILAVIN